MTMIKMAVLRVVRGRGEREKIRSRKEIKKIRRGREIAGIIKLVILE